MSAIFTLDGEVRTPLRLTFDDLQALPQTAQVHDVSSLDPRRSGAAVRLAHLLDMAAPSAAAHYLTLHASSDDFHASIPLAAVRDRAVLIYKLSDGPLPASAGGPFRFFIPDFAACHTDQVDECANVKYVDRLEISNHRGFDNRPQDDRQHTALHRRPDSTQS